MDQSTERERAIRVAAQIKAMGYEVMPSYDGGMRVLVLMDEAPETYGKSKIIIADTHKRTPLVGTIVAVSPVKAEDLPNFVVEPGMRVLVQWYDAKEVRLNLRDGLTTMRLLSIADIYVKWINPENEGVSDDNSSVDGGVSDPA